MMNRCETAREKLTFDDISHDTVKQLGITTDQVNWFSTYRVHHRVADRFAEGRAFLLGDAGHVHSPVGGQAAAPLETWCRNVGMALHVFPWRDECGQAGFAQNAAYLVRPDGYVAVASPDAAHDSFENHRLQWSLPTLSLERTPCSPRGFKRRQHSISVLQG